MQEVRILVVREIGKELSQEKFHDLPTIQTRGQVIETMWEALTKKLEQCRRTLSRYHDLMSVFADIDDCLSDMVQIEVCKYHSSLHKLLQRTCILYILNSDTPYVLHLGVTEV